MGGDERGALPTLGLVMLLLLTALSTLVSSPVREENLISEPIISETIQIRQNFTTAQGFTLSNLTVDPVSGITSLIRPSMSWQTPGGMGLGAIRTGACSAFLPSTNQIFLIGGRVDTNPTQTGDETISKLVEVYDVTNRTWDLFPQELKVAQQYHKCAVAGDKIYAIGDHYPYASPTQRATGLVQVYDPTVGNWSIGNSMPGNASVGLAGVASLGGMIYVAGGVTAHDRSDMTDRLMRYDPINDVWTQLQSMNNRRHSFELVAFKGKLIAYGGVARFFDPAQNATVEEDTNLSEAYDPITNTWTQLPNATHALSAYAAAVFNQEIIIHGGYTAVTPWQGTINTKTYGYDPFKNIWNTYGTHPIGMYDSTLVRANNSLVYATGDTSSPRFSTWNTQYLAETKYHLNPAEQSGMLTSSIQDLRSTQHSAASLLWFKFSAVEPTGSSLGLQYRTAATMQGIASTQWLPSSVPVNTYLSAGNTSLTDAIEDAPFVQYRVRYATTDLMNWVTPTLAEVNIGADSVGFVSTVPKFMQPTSAPITITTIHHAVTQDGTYQLKLHPSNNVGSLLQGTNWMNLSWDTATSSLQVVDTDGILFGQPTATLREFNASGQKIDWTFSLGGTMPSDYLKVMATTFAQRNATYLHPVIVSIDRNVTVEISKITADVSSKGDETLESNEVVPGNTELNISIDHFFSNSGLGLLGGAIQSRLHLDVETYDVDVFGERIWLNDSSEWFFLPSGETEHALLRVGETVSGEAHLWFEARTSESWDLTFSTAKHRFIINGESPTLLKQTPILDAYINEKSQQTISFEFYDVGGFTNTTLRAFAWIEARDDGQNGEQKDGIAQRDEYQEVTPLISSKQNVWTINLTVNDTINTDHQGGRILLEGGDLAGFDVPFATPEMGHARWQSRTPYRSSLLSFTATQNVLEQGMMRFEPSQKIGWQVEVEDLNNLNDIMEVRIELGNDNGLGIKYTTLDQACASLDERLLILPSDCQVTKNNGVLTLDMTATVEWSFTHVGLVDGEIDVYIRDVDGLTHEDFSDAWVLERDLRISILSLRDDDGEVQQAISQNSILMAKDRLNLSAQVSHLSSGTAYDGILRLRWDGKIQNNNWKGGVTVDISDGQLNAFIPTPEMSGLIHDLTLTLWDPLETEVLSSFDVHAFGLDNAPPVLLPSSIQNSISRYHLDEVEVGVNIDEAQGWSSPLQLSCQVRSLTKSWEIITLTRNATTVFNGKTMFSFTFDFSQSGDPSTLSTQAMLACWAEGQDDAGWSLTSAAGNSDLDPWLETPLNNIGPDLAIQDVELHADVKPGEKVTLSFLVVNNGETITTPFNASIEIVQGEKRTLVGRSIFSAMEENTAKSVKRAFDAPEGAWTLVITVDLEQHVWEIDEANNRYVKELRNEQNGLGGMLMLFSGIGLIGAIIAMVLRKRSKPELDTPKLAAALSEFTEPVQPSVHETPKTRGPPGAKVSTESQTITFATQPKSPPRGPPKSPPTETELSPQAMAAQYLSALGSPTPQANLLKTRHVPDYSQLPGGGEYQYTTEGTFYVGNSCGRWKLNDDKSFTKMDDVQ